MKIDGGINMMYPQAVEREKRIDGDKPKGRKVRYTQAGGSQNDWRYANKFLELGNVYTVGEIYVYSSHSDVVLANLPDVVFNSAIFEDLEPENESDDFLPPEESEKVVLTKEQVEAIKTFLNDNGNDELHLIDWHNATRSPYTVDIEYRPLVDLKASKLATALFIGYEIEEPTPQFERGDKVVIWKRIITLGDFRIFEGKRQWAMKEPPFMWVDEEDLTKPTQDEIYWLHDLNRDYVQDFREGDVVIVKKNNETYVVTNESIGNHNCTPYDATFWYQKDLIKYIYPVESRKVYRKEEN